MLQLLKIDFMTFKQTTFEFKPISEDKNLGAQCDKIVACEFIQVLLLYVCLTDKSDNRFLNNGGV